MFTLKLDQVLERIQNRMDHLEVVVSHLNQDGDGEVREQCYARLAELQSLSLEFILMEE